MPTEQEIDDHRNRLAASLKREEHDLDAQKLKIESRLADIAAILKRLKTNPPANACYRCYFESGVISRVSGVPFDCGATIKMGIPRQSG